MNSRLLRLALLTLPTLLLLGGSGCLHTNRLAVFDSGRLDQAASEPAEPLPPMPELTPQMGPAKALETNAAGELLLTVEEAVTSALRHNKDLQIEQLGPVIAGTFEAIERGSFDPELFGQLTVTQEDKIEADRNGIPTAEQSLDRSLQIGVRQRLPTGTTLELSAEQARNDSNRNLLAAQDSRLGLSLTQSLLRGFGQQVNLVKVRQAELGTAISTYELRGFLEALLSATEIAYWDYVLAGQQIEIFEQSLAVARQQRDEIEQRIEVGLLPRIEAAAANAEMARRQQALIDVRSGFEESRLRLLRLLNPQEGDFDLRIKATSPAEIDPAPITDLSDRLQLAAQARPDLNEARLRRRQNRLETILTRNGLLPRLDLFITLGKSGYADSFADALRDLDGENFDLQAGLTLSHPLGNRQAKARDLAAHASWRQAAEAVDNLQQLVELDVRLAVNEFERSRQQIAASRATRLLQEETLQAEMERFEVGASTALLIAQAQRDLLESALAEVEAIINCRQALVRLYLAEGTLLERRGVRLAALDRERP